MAEIKSTLDLVMEKTKNLKITEEEREQQNVKKLQGKVKGILQKYIDGVFSFDMSLEALARENNTAHEAKNLLLAAALDRIDPIGDRAGANDRVLTFLKKLSPAQEVLAFKLLMDFQRAIQAEREKVTSDIKEKWKASGLNGTALVPNLDKDAAWKAYCEKTRIEFRKAAKLL